MVLQVLQKYFHKKYPGKGRRQNKMQNLYQLDVYPKLLFEAVAA